jgi:putative redox protein
MQVSVKLERIEKLKFNVTLPTDRRLELNSAKEMGQAFTPMELFLVALAGCTAMDVQWILDRQKQTVDRLEINAGGKRRVEDPRYYETIDLEYSVAGPSITKAAVERAIRLSQEKYCSVRAMLKDDVEVHIRYRISNGTEPEQKYELAAPST